MTLNRRRQSLSSLKEEVKMCQPQYIWKGAKVCSILCAMILVFMAYLLGTFWF